MTSSANFSRCGNYRYLLTRIWDSRVPSVLFVALNPSTADAIQNDPTIRRCIGFARSWGYGGMVMANLFAFRSTNPAALKTTADPVGPRNNQWISKISQSCGITVAAWGAHTLANDRATTVLPMLKNVHHLGLTRDGFPRHPLYVRGSVQPAKYVASCA